eukprot:GHVP01035242.1.p1 GENE.GHVP01035242.1~~GHVP01035242.1.p1  ORF type:complete len:131 (+),score=17.60 GHVP01035242.1:68-460(+)
MTSKSEIRAGLAGTFLMAMNGNSSNSTTFETTEAHYPSPKENFIANCKDLEDAKKGVEQFKKESVDFFIQTDLGKEKRKIGTLVSEECCQISMGEILTQIQHDYDVDRFIEEMNDMLIFPRGSPAKPLVD